MGLLNNYFTNKIIKVIFRNIGHSRKRISFENLRPFKEGFFIPSHIIIKVLFKVLFVST
jgi:hypothetical protein